MQYCYSPNKDTTKTKKDVLVLHITESPYLSAVHHLRNPYTQASAHYILGSSLWCQMVPVEERAWHAGKVVNPTNRFKRVSRYFEGKNPNEYCMGIEFCATRRTIFNKSRPNSYQWKTLLEIVDDWNPDIKDKYIITHRDITSYKPNLERVRIEFLLRLKIHRLKKKLVEIIKKKIAELYERIAYKT